MVASFFMASKNSFFTYFDEQVKTLKLPTLKTGGPTFTLIYLLLFLIWSLLETVEENKETKFVKNEAKEYLIHLFQRINALYLRTATTDTGRGLVGDLNIRHGGKIMYPQEWNHAFTWERFIKMFKHYRSRGV